MNATPLQPWLIALPNRRILAAHCKCMAGIGETFHNYHEIFEELRAAVEQCYRHLLEDSIQDAVFLSACNNELVLEDQVFQQQMKDVITKLGGRLPSSVVMPM